MRKVLVGLAALGLFTGCGDSLPTAPKAGGKDTGTPPSTRDPDVKGKSAGTTKPEEKGKSAL